MRLILIIITIFILLSAGLGCRAKYEWTVIDNKFWPEKTIETQIYMSGLYIPDRDVYIGVPVSIHKMSYETSIVFQDGKCLIVDTSEEIDVLKSFSQWGKLTMFVVFIDRGKIKLDYFKFIGVGDEKS